MRRDHHDGQLRPLLGKPRLPDFPTPGGQGLDDYLRDVAHDRKAAVEESDIRQAGLAVAKRSYAVFKERGYEAVAA